MMKTVADALAAFHENAIASSDAAGHAKAVHVLGMVDDLSMDTLDLVETTLPISVTFRRLREAARLYAAGDPRERDRMTARRDALRLAVYAFAVALDGAKADEAVAFVTGVDTTQVPNPIGPPATH